MTMASMTEPRELFIYELGDILYAERVLAKALRKLEKEASDEELAESFKEHQIGIKQEHDEFVKEQSPSAEVLDAFLTGAGGLDQTGPPQPGSTVAASRSA
jgi:uncharacterized protein DUF892